MTSKGELGKIGVVNEATYDDRPVLCHRARTDMHSPIDLLFAKDTVSHDATAAPQRGQTDRSGIWESFFKSAGEKNKETRNGSRFTPLLSQTTLTKSWSVVHLLLSRVAATTVQMNSQRLYPHNARAHLFCKLERQLVCFVASVLSVSSSCIQTPEVR